MKYYCVKYNIINSNDIIIINGNIVMILLILMK